VRRVSVVGNAGSGKTTVGRDIAGRLGVAFVELDAVFHQPGWRPTPPEEFRHRVEAIVAGEGWVLDGNYSAVRDLVWGRADTVIWLDPPRRVVMRQVVGRTLRRTLTRVELWNGNREPVSGLFRLDPEKSIIRLAWLKHDVYSRRFAAFARDPAWAHLSFVRIASRQDVARLLARLGPPRRP
jgi:adenylate kinase family enzyme